MVRIILCWIGLFGLIFGFAQNQSKADSLKRIYATLDSNHANRLTILYEIAFNDSNPSEIIKYSELLISAAQERKDEHQESRGYLQQGNGYRLSGNYDRAFKSYFKGLELANSVNNRSAISSALGSIGDAYSVLDDSKNALKYYRSAVNYFDKSDKRQIGSVLFNMGDEYLKLQSFDSALFYFEKSMLLFNEIDFKLGQAYCKGNMAIVKAEKGLTQSAEILLYEATETLAELGDSYGISSYQIAIADIYLKMKYPMGALIHANNAYNNALMHDLKEQIRDASLKLSEIYESTRKTKKAIDYLKTYIQYNDSLSNPATISRVAEIRQEYEEAQKEPEVNEQTITLTRTRPIYYALIIGINDYQYNQGSLVDLGQPIGDALELKKTLIESYTFEDENIIYLENPTRSGIINALEALSATVTEKDNLLIFYAGHGVWDAKLQVGYWLPSDAKIDSKGNWLSNSSVRDYVSGLKTKHTLLITDACFSGSIFKTRSVDYQSADHTLQDEGFAKLYRLPSRKAMTSGTLQIVPDHSKFMHFMNLRLTENKKNYITARQLFSLIETAVINNTDNVPQYGTIQNAGDEGGDFIFIRK
jgi:tetratricopeptide (TPR) repeat protein